MLPLQSKDLNREQRQTTPDNATKHSKSSLLETLITRNQTVRRGSRNASEMNGKRKQLKPALMTPRPAKRMAHRSPSPQQDNTHVPPETSHIPEMIAQPAECYIARLSIECLYHIFKFCADPYSLCMASRTCRRWRAIATDALTWRTLDMTWSGFLNQMELLTRSGVSRVLHLYHTQTLVLSASSLDATFTHWPRSPFKRLSRLRLSQMYLNDIIGLATAVPALEVIQCSTVRLREESHSLVLAAFSKLHRLRVLELSFLQPCEHAGCTFVISSRLQRPLPASLNSLALTNMYDAEEDLLSRDETQRDFDKPSVILRWRMMEDSLLQKYQALSQLTQLRSLTLGRCSGFTARVWRECLQPCVANLEYLCLLTWRPGQEAPSEWARRHTLARSIGTDVANVTEDVEEALGEFLVSLQSLHTLVLQDFWCGAGTIHGILTLSKHKPGSQITVAATGLTHEPSEYLYSMKHNIIEHATLTLPSLV